MKEGKIELPDFIKAEYLENGKPLPRDLTRTGQILEVLYNLADHLFLSSWRGFDDFCPFNVKSMTKEYNVHFNRTIIERTIAQSYAFGEIRTDNIRPVFSGKGHEVSLESIELSVQVINGLIDLSDEELHADYGNVHLFRIQFSRNLHASLLYFVDTCMNMIVLHWIDSIKGHLSTLAKEDVKEYLLRNKKELKQKQAYNSKKVYDDVMLFLDPELEFYNAVNESGVYAQLKKMVSSQLSKREGISYSSDLLQRLAENDFEGFIVRIREYVLSTFSSFDISGSEQEKLYHVMLTTMLSRLDHYYTIKSNLESGLGRFDIALSPNENDLTPILMELKSLSERDYKQSTVEMYAENAINQIIDKKYATIFKDAGFKNYVAIAVIFKGKDLSLKYKMLDIT